MKKTAYFILRKLSIIIGVLLIIYLIGIKAVQWIHTESGQKFVTKRIAAQLKDSGIRLDSLRYTYLDGGLYDVNATGVAQTHPFTLKARLNPQRYRVDVENIIATLPALTVKGGITYEYGKNFATGKLEGTLNSLKPYHKPSEVKPVTFAINLKPASLIQITANTKSYNNTDIGLSLRDINTKATFQKNLLTIQSINLKDLKQGTANISGTYNTQTQKADITAIVKNLDPNIKNISGKIDANLKITGKGPNLIAQGTADLKDKNGGTINAKGKLFAQSQKADITITMRDFDPNVQNVKGKINADITLTGKPQAYLLQGSINPQKMTITLPDQFATSVQQVNIVKKGQKKPTPDFTKTLGLDLVVNAPKQIYVLGMGLDAEFGGKLKVGGFADDPQVKGDLKIIRGRFSEFGKTFNITKATLEFFGSIPPSPELDIETQTKAGEITAKILITGPAQKPKISFSSIPEKPEDEVVSYILFGKDPADLSAIQAIQLARSVAKFSGVVKGGGPDPIVALRNATGLDDISVETDEEGNVNVGAKKRINDRVTLEVESGSEPGSAGAKIEIELTPSITLESEIGQDASGGAGIFWKRDY